jgi:hypothetical protein
MEDLLPHQDAIATFPHTVPTSHAASIPGLPLETLVFELLSPMVGEILPRIVRPAGRHP